MSYVYDPKDDPNLTPPPRRDDGSGCCGCIFWLLLLPPMLALSWYASHCVWELHDHQQRTGEAPWER